MHGGHTTQGAKFTGYDPHGNSHDIVRSPSTAGGDEDGQEDSDDNDSEGTVRDTARTTIKAAQSEVRTLNQVEYIQQ